MHPARPPWILRGSTAILTLLLIGSLHAQPATPGGRPDPLNPQAAVPPVLHRPALAGYRAAGELKLGSWREANDTVTRIGGWRVYAREAAGLDPAPASSAPASESAPVPAPASAPATAVPASAARPASAPGHHQHHHGKP